MSRLPPGPGLAASPERSEDLGQGLRRIGGRWRCVDPHPGLDEVAAVDERNALRLKGFKRLLQRESFQVLQRESGERRRAAVRQTQKGSPYATCSSSQGAPRSPVSRLSQPDQ